LPVLIAGNYKAIAAKNQSVPFCLAILLCDDQLLSEKENPSHEVAKPQREGKVKGGFFLGVF
jgi:hypothetical protein